MKLFCIDPSPSYFACVKYALLNESGKLEEHDLSIKFKRLNVSEIESFIQRFGEKLSPETVQKLLLDVVIGWRDITDAQGQDVPFNEVNFKKLMQLPGMMDKLSQGLIDSWRPTEHNQVLIHEAAEKN